MSTTPTPTPTTIHHFIGGKPYPSQTTEWRDVTNPATQEVVARVPFATREEVELAVANAHAAFQTWRSTSLGARMRIMLKLQQLIREHTSELAQLITREHGKTLPDAEGEVARGLEVVEHACSITRCSWAKLSRTPPPVWTCTTCCSRWAWAQASLPSTSR